MKRLLILFAFAACLVTGACSLGKLAYSNAAFAYTKVPPALAWMVGDYVDLSGDQKDWLRERVDAALVWHRARELPQYQHFCEEILAYAAAGSVTPAQVGDMDRELRDYYNRMLDHVTPDLADLLLQLDTDQTGQLDRKFAKDNLKMVHDAEDGTAADRSASRTKKYLVPIEEFVGDLTDAQNAIVKRYADGYEELTQYRLADRQYRQSETLRMIGAKVSREEMIAGLHRLFVETRSWRSPEYRRKLAERDEKLYAMISELAASLSMQQRAYLQTRVRGYMGDIAGLSASR